MLRFLALIGCLMLLTTAPVHARTDGGDLLWQDQLDFAGGDDIGMAVAAAGGRVAVVGSAHTARGDADAVVRAYNAKSGELLWRDQVGDASAEDKAVAVAMNAQRIVVAAQMAGGSGLGQLVVRSYDPKKGTVDWEVRSPAADVTGLAMDDGRVVVTGAVEATGGGQVPFIRVYSAKRGTLLWANESLPAGHALLHRSYQYVNRAVALHGDTAFVMANVVELADPGLEWQCLVRAYHVARGTLLWESLSKTSAPNCRPLAVGTDGRHVFIAGQTGPFIDDLYVRSYDAETGALLWQARTFLGTGFDNAAIAVDTERRTVFAAGWRIGTTPPFNEVFLIRAHDVDTGELRWEDPFTPDGRCLCRARDLVAEGGRVFAVGDGNDGSVGFVRVYDAKRGDVLWEDEFAGEPTMLGERTIIGLQAVAVDGGRVFVAGSFFNANGNADIIVRAYDAK